MLDARVYRTAFLPALLALFVVGFALSDRPGPASSPLRADGFSAARAYESLRALGTAVPSRRAGSAGDARLADRVAGVMQASGFRVRRTLRGGRTVDGTRDLETVVGVRQGLSDRQIVVLAHRDALGRRALAELSGTAGLIELARVFRSRGPADEVRGGERPRVVGRELRKTLVLVSTSGGAAGAAGARTWARDAARGGRVDGVLVLGDLAGARARRPWAVPWSNDDDPTALRLRRTLEAAVRAEALTSPGVVRGGAQLVRRAFPATSAEVGAVAAAGLPAVGLSASGERGPAADAPVREERLEALGRSALRWVSAVDADTRGADAGATGIEAARNVVPDWSLRLLVGALLLPALLAAIDALARARRRRLPVGAATARMAALAAIPLAAWLWLRVLGLAGALDAPPGPVLPGADAPSFAEWLALASVPLAVTLAVLALRPVLRARPHAARTGRRFDRPADGRRFADVEADQRAAALGPAVGVVLVGLAAVVWLANPHAGLLLVPAAHLWLLVATGPPRWRGPLGVTAVLAGTLPLALVPLHYAAAWGADPLELGWTAVLAVAGGHLSLATAVVLCGLAAVLAGVVRTLVRAPRGAGGPDVEPPRARIVTRGPLSYAGPGSLGGTESALRR